MRRVGFSPVDTGDAGNLYTINYQCKMIDKSAVDEKGIGNFSDVKIEKKQSFIIP